MKPTTPIARPSRRPLVGLALAAFMAVAGLAGAGTPGFAPPVPEVRRLENGLTVGVMRDGRLPLVHVQFAFLAGTASEGPGEQGAASIVSDLVGRATTSRDADALRAELDRAGAVVSSQLGRDITLIGLTCLSRDLPEGMELLGDVALDPVFTPTDFDRVRRARRQAVSRTPHPARQGEDAIWAAVFGSGPYARPALAPAGALDSLTLGQVRTFHRAHWAAGRAVLAVVGDVDVERAFAAAKEWLGTSAQEGKPPASPAPAPPGARSARIIDRSDATLSEVFIGLPGPRVGDRDEVAIALASEMARRQGAVLRNFRVSQVALKDGGIVWLGATAAHDSVGRAVKALEAVLTNLRTRSVREGALDSLKRGVNSAFTMRFETLAGTASQWCAGAVMGSSAADLAAFPDRVDSVTTQRLMDATKRWFDPAKLAIVVVGPAGKVKPQLQGLAPLAAVGAGAGATAAVTPAEEKKGREILNRGIAAHGGLPRLKKVLDSVTSAKVTLRLGGDEQEGEIEVTRKEPGRMVYVSKFKGYGSRQVLDGNRAWSAPLDSLTAIRNEDQGTVDAMIQGYRSDVPHVLLDAGAPKTQAAARPPGVVDGRSVENVEVWTSAGDHRTLSFDAKTHLLAGLEQREPGPQGADVLMRRAYGDYREVSEIQMPFDEGRWLGAERVMHFEYTRVAVNVGVSDAVFRRPEAPLPPPSR